MYEDEITTNFYGDNLFVFNSYKASCHIKDKNIIVNANNEEPIKFAYVAKEGLKLIKGNGVPTDDNILGELLDSINSNKKLSNFIENYGFIFPLKPNTPESFPIDSIKNVILHIKLTIDLINSINNPKINYHDIVRKIIRLIIQKECTIKFQNGDMNYKTNVSKILQQLEMPSSLSSTRNQESFDKNTYTINDSIKGKYELDINLYNDSVSGALNDKFYSDTIRTFCNVNCDEELRNAIDFLFHYQHDVMKIDWNILFEDIDISDLSEKKISQGLKDAILNTAKYIIGDEINANLRGVQPIYEYKNLSAKWNIESLIAATYFSLFYLKPNLQLYRQCANPKCKQYFLVSTTSSNKKYCSNDCGNRVRQDRNRQKKRQNSK